MAKRREKPIVLDDLGTLLLATLLADLLDTTENYARLSAVKPAQMNLDDKYQAYILAFEIIDEMWPEQPVSTLVAERMTRFSAMECS